MKRFIRLSFCLFITSSLYSQSISGENYQGSVGLNLTFGTTVNRIGLFAKGFYIHKDVQFNLDTRYHFNISSYGPRLSGPEWSLKGGVVWAWGEQASIENPFLSPVGNQIEKTNSLGYSFNYYWDKIGTNQATGTLSVQFDKVNFIMENDAFAPPAADKFRTAAIKFTYRIQENTYLTINSTLWTGDPFTDMLDTQRDLAHYPSRYGFRDMSYTKYGKFSHGILSVGLQQILPFQQEIRYNLGVDSEWVRHILQNVIIHDLYFIPNIINPAKHPHIPMVSNTGEQYLFYSHQEVKPASFYGQFSMNGTLFY